MKKDCPNFLLKLAYKKQEEYLQKHQLQKYMYMNAESNTLFCNVHFKLFLLQWAPHTVKHPNYSFATLHP